MFCRRCASHGLGAWSRGAASSGFELPKELFKQFRQLSHDIFKEGKELTTCQTSNGPRRPPGAAAGAALIPPQLAKLNLTKANCRPAATGIVNQSGETAEPCTNCGYAWRGADRKIPGDRSPAGRVLGRGTARLAERAAAGA